MTKFSSGWKAVLPLALGLAFLASSARAHTTGLSSSDLKLGTNGLRAEITLAGVDLALALAHLETGTPTDANHDGKLTAEELAAGLTQLRKFAAACLAVEFDGQAVPPGPARFALDEQDNFRLELDYPGPRPQRLRARATLFRHLPPEHLHFLAVQAADGRALGNKMLRATDDLLELQLPGESGPPARRLSSFTDFLKLGVEHIWTGYDHLLFLLALLLACANCKSALQVVTCFTVAHSVTLALATLNLVWVSGRVVEPAIAASIIYVGVENFARPEGPKGRWAITFLFGLIHGFGFASVLRDLGVAAGTTGVTVPLVAFNLGVELGQVVIAGLLLPAIWQLRKWGPFRRRGGPVCSVLVTLAGGYWLIQRLFFG